MKSRQSWSLPPILTTRRRPSGNFWAIIMRFTSLFIIASTLLSIVFALPAAVPKDQSPYVYFILVYIMVPIYLIHPAPNAVPMLEAMLSPLSLVDLKSNPMSYLTEMSRTSSDVRKEMAPRDSPSHQKSLSVKEREKILTTSAYTEKRGGKRRNITRTWSNRIWKMSPMLIQQCKFLFVGPGQNFAAESRQSPENKKSRELVLIFIFVEGCTYPRSLLMKFRRNTLYVHSIHGM